MSVASRALPLQMRLGMGRCDGECYDFRNSCKPQTLDSRPRSEVESSYSSTLSSSFFLPQSAAACTKASTTGCGFFSLDDSCGWNNVATKKRCIGDSIARISPCGPRATTGNPASIVVHSKSGLISKLQKNSSVTVSLSLP